MSQVTLLNLDEMAPIRRSVTFGGNSYRVKEMTVEHFIEMNKLAEELEKKNIDTPVEGVNATIRSVTLSLEDCPESEVRKLSIEQLATLSKFIRNELSPSPAAAGGEESGKPEAQPNQG
jgi:hypothetical protein